jgi:hypothetical protein
MSAASAAIGDTSIPVTTAAASAKERFIEALLLINKRHEMKPPTSGFHRETRDRHRHDFSFPHPAEQRGGHGDDEIVFGELFLKIHESQCFENCSNFRPKNSGALSPIYNTSPPQFAPW